MGWVEFWREFRLEEKLNALKRLYPEDDELQHLGAQVSPVDDTTLLHALSMETPHDIAGRLLWVVCKCVFTCQQLT